MRNAAFVLACLAWAVSTRRMQMAWKREESSQATARLEPLRSSSRGSSRDTHSRLNALATLLLDLDQTSAFNPTGLGAHAPMRKHARVGLRPAVLNDANQRTPVISMRTPIEDLKVGTEVVGVVIRVLGFGAFIDIGASVDALLPSAEIDAAAEEITEGQTVKLTIKSINRAKQLMTVTCEGPDGRTPVEDLKIGAEVEGNVTAIMSFGAFVDIGATVDALLPVSKAADAFVGNISAKFSVGDKVKARVLTVDSESDKLSITCKTTDEDLDLIPLAKFEVGAEVEGKVNTLTDFGAFVDIGAATEALLPLTEAAEERLSNISEKYSVGDTVKARVIKVDLDKKQLAISVRAERTPLEKLEVGMEVEGTVKALASFGAFVDIGASSDCLLPVGEASNDFVSNISDILNVGDHVKGVIQTVDVAKQRLSMSCKTEEDMSGKLPLDKLDEGLEVEGTIRAVQSFGIFVNVGATVDALVPTVEASDDFIGDLAEKFTVGEVVKGRLIKVDLEKQQLAMSLRGEKVPLEKLEVGAEVEGTVKTIMDYGAFVDIGAPKEGLLPNRNMIGDVTVGDTIKVRIATVDLNDQKFSLTCKDEIDETPAASGTPLEELKVGAAVEGLITSVVDFGAFVNIGAAKDALLPKSNIEEGFTGDPSEKLKEGETIKAQITSVDINKQRVSISCLEGAAAGSKTPLEELKVNSEVEGKVMQVMSYGAFVDIGAQRDALMPTTEMLDSDGKSAADLFTVGETIKCHIVRVDVEKQQVQLSQKSSLDDIEVGSEVEGTVKSVLAWGAFVNIGASTDMLLPVAHISNEMVMDAREKLKVGDTVKGKVRSVDVEGGRLTMTCLDETDLKPLGEFKVGEEVEGKIVRLVKNGATLDIGSTEEAFLPAAGSKLTVGDMVKTTIRNIDLAKKQLDVAPAGTTVGTPLEELEVGSEVEGKVKSVVNFGAFVDLGASVDALVTARDGGSRMKAGETVKCKIEEINLEKQQLRASLVDDSRIPLTELKVGSEVEGTVKAKLDFGVFLDIGAVTDALLHRSQAKARPVGSLKVGETITVKIDEVDLEKEQIKASTEADPNKKSLESLQIGTSIEGTITSVLQWGAFVDVGAVTEALLPSREVELEADDEGKRDLKGKFNVGDVVKARISNINLDKQQFEISLLERRIDPKDGNTYTQAEFRKFYGNDWQANWNTAVPLDAFR